MTTDDNLVVLGLRRIARLYPEIADTANDGADEIERLRAELAQAKAVIYRDPATFGWTR